MSILWFHIAGLHYAHFTVRGKVYRILQSDLEAEYEGIYDQLQAEGLGLV